MADLGELARGRDAFTRGAWTEAYTHLAAADQQQPLDADHLDILAAAAYLLGRDEESAEFRARAHQGFLNRGDVERAARSAFWLAFGLMQYGARTRAAAWLTRARQLLEDDRDCVEHGYLLLPAALQQLFGGDAASAYETFCRAAAIGSRFGDRDLSALACHSRGRVLIRLGRVQEGVDLLDDAMVAVDAREVSPLVVGEVYCSVVEGCLEIFDLRRAHEWTAALTHWCDSQPDLVVYRGQCLVRRAEILQLHGAWREACEAAERACERLTRPSVQPASGAAFYQRGELHRLFGEFAEAEAAYREASRRGRKPQPGLALMRLAQGQTAQAANAIRLALGEAQGPNARARLLPAYVEIVLAAGDVPAARQAAEEIAQIAATVATPALHALAAHARGAVLLAEGEADTAQSVLNQAWSTWQELSATYDAARSRVLLALAARDLGDTDTAEMEIDAARWTFQQLGAGPDVLRVDALSRGIRARAEGGLSARELEVLRLVASGRTNRQIAAGLSISERTVERHLSNIFQKIDVSSRAAATAYAYRHRLV